MAAAALETVTIRLLIDGTLSDPMQIRADTILSDFFNAHKPDGPGAYSLTLGHALRGFGPKALAEPLSILLSKAIGIGEVNPESPILCLAIRKTDATQMMNAPKNKGTQELLLRKWNEKVHVGLLGESHEYIEAYEPLGKCSLKNLAKIKEIPIRGRGQVLIFSEGARVNPCYTDFETGSIVMSEFTSGEEQLSCVVAEFQPFVHCVEELHRTAENVDILRDPSVTGQKREVAKQYALENLETTGVLYKHFLHILKLTDGVESFKQAAKISREGSLAFVGNLREICDRFIEHIRTMNMNEGEKAQLITNMQAFRDSDMNPEGVEYLTLLQNIIMLRDMRMLNLIYNRVRDDPKIKYVSILIGGLHYESQSNLIKTHQDFSTVLTLNEGLSNSRVLRGDNVKEIPSLSRMIEEARAAAAEKRAGQEANNAALAARLAAGNNAPGAPNLSGIIEALHRMLENGSAAPKGGSRTRRRRSKSSKKTKRARHSK
jgi:hypothetical protein